MLVSVEERKPENPEKNHRSKARVNNKLNPHMAPGRNRTQATLVGSERSHDYPIPDYQKFHKKGFKKKLDLEWYSILE